MSELTQQSTKPAGPTPVSSDNRIEIVDILRGFAIFGILLVNIYSFAGLSLSPQSELDLLDRLAIILVIFLAQAKFYSLFSFLFGWGTYFQLARANQKGGSFIPLHLRRMAILLGIGLLHGLLIWHGDILTTYAVLGVLLLLFRKSSERTLLIAAGLFLLLSIVVVLPGNMMEGLRQGYADLTAFMRPGSSQPQLIFATGRYEEITQRRINDFISGQSWFIYWLGNVFAMMLLGFYVGKRKIFSDIQRVLPRMRQLIWIFLAFGILFMGVSLWVTVNPNAVPVYYQRFLRVTSRSLGAPALMLFYVSAIILLAQNEKWRRRLSVLAPVGRMALTNYLLQSIVATLIFYNYGLGLYGEITPTIALFMTILFYLGQIRFSQWWMERYRYGPAEWLWRTLTYGQLQRIRKGESKANQNQFPWLSNLRQSMTTIYPLISLMIVWILLVVWAIGLFNWNSRLKARLESVPFAAAVQPVSEPESDAERRVTQQDSAPDVEDSQESVDAIVTPVVQPVDFDPVPVAAAGDVRSMATVFDVDKARAHIDALADERFSGRLAGSDGGRAAADYIADYFDLHLLQPAGDDGSFFQSFPISYTVLRDKPSISVSGPFSDSATGVKNDYILYEDFSPVVIGYAGGGAGSGQVVWVNHCARQDFDDLNVAGKIVLCKPELGNDVLIASSRHALEHGAEGLLLLTTPEERPADFGNRYQDVWVPVSIPVLRVYPDLAGDLLVGSEIQLAELLDGEEPFLLDTEVELSVSASEVEKFEARNVLGVIPGRDPQSAQEVVIIGAHYDHLGQGPDGTIWSGANDNASGVAALLEIARSWQELGYVPRRTVLFAAWDAEEWGLFGSQYYVNKPRYPLDQTIATINLDMIGSGADTLAIGGEQELADQIFELAETKGTAAAISELGRSDHIPFLEAGVPSVMLIWYDHEQTIDHYHRPTDTPSVIEAEKLEVASELAEETLLNLVESQPAIELLLTQRAVAASQGDMTGFLATSRLDQSATDRTWLADLQTINPQAVEMSAVDLQVNGNSAAATVEIDVTYPDRVSSDGVDEIVVSLPVQFERGDFGWLWAGVDLNWAGGLETGDNKPTFEIAYPHDVEEDLSGIGQLAAGQYHEIATKLGLTPKTDAQVLLMPDAEALRANTALTISPGTHVWVEPGVVKIVYNKEISQSKALKNALVQLVLADAGVSEEAAPWLWLGLPQVWHAVQDPIAIQSRFLPALNNLPNDDQLTPPEAWAAVEFLIQQIGWEGLGQFIVDLGQACRLALCATEEGLDAILDDTLGMEANSFEQASHNYWLTRLEEVQRKLDSLMVSRESALLTGDEAAFLETIDPSLSYLVASERHWLRDLQQNGIERFNLSATPLTLFDDGTVLAEIALEYSFEGAGDEQIEDRILQNVIFSQEGGGFRWAGTAMQSISGEYLTLRYPQKETELAVALLADAEPLYLRLAQELEVGSPEPVVIELISDEGSFRVAVGLSESSEWMASWSAPESGVKLKLLTPGTAADYYSSLTDQLARQLLYQQGVDSEWLLTGTSAFLAAREDNHTSRTAMANGLPELFQLAQGGIVGSLSDMVSDDSLPRQAAVKKKTRAWDSVNYLVETYGWQALLDLIKNQGQSNDLDAALNATLEKSIAVFELEWADSLRRGHARQAWVEDVDSFDGAMAYQHVEYLASPRLAGRQAGTAEARMAADYIAGEFADAGLLPYGEGQNSTFLQTFPITYFIWLEEPQLILSADKAPFVHHFDVVPVRATLDDPGEVSGELVWIGDSIPATDLTGKIAVRLAAGINEMEVAQTSDVGAEGLLLLGFQKEDEELFAKKPLSEKSIGKIPVLELTFDGTLRFLEDVDHTYDTIQELSAGESLGTEARMAASIASEGQVMAANVLGLLPGCDPFLRDDLIILGAHYDHVGDDPGTHYGGANDNASGVAVMLETARMWQEMGYKPKRSVLFAAWDAQELGQLGSSHYVMSPTFPLTDTLLMLQLDGVGGGEGFYPGVQGEVGQDGLPLHYLQVAAELLDEKLVMTSPTSESDHLSFTLENIPASLVNWRLAGEENLPDDFANGVSQDHMTLTGRIVSLALMMLAQ